MTTPAQLDMLDPLPFTALVHATATNPTFRAKLAQSHQDPPRTRSKDPVVSHDAEVDAAPRMKGQKAVLLATWEAWGPMTAEEGCAKAGLPSGWRRVADLVREGKLERTGESRPNVSGSMADVLRIPKQALTPANP